MFANRIAEVVVHELDYCPTDRPWRGSLRAVAKRDRRAAPTRRGLHIDYCTRGEKPLLLGLRYALRHFRPRSSCVAKKRALI